MPNHVENDLVIRGPKKDVAAFLEAVRGEREDHNGKTVVIPLDHNKVIPYPQHYADADAKAEVARKKGNWDVKDGYNQGGYEWCLSNWGTKWGFYDFSELDVSKSGTSAKVSFSTAWSPAFPLFQKMSEMFPSLTFTVRYFERGMGFQGIYKAKGGSVLEDLSSNDYRGRRGG